MVSQVQFQQLFETRDAAQNQGARHVGKIDALRGYLPFSSPALPRQVQEIADPDPAQHLVKQRVPLG